MVLAFSTDAALAGGDALGDACDGDDDADGVTDLADNCRRIANAAPRNCDHDGDRYGDACDPDLNNNGSVTISDFNSFKVSYTAASPAADLTCNGSVSIVDFNRFKVLYNQTGAGEASSGGRLDSCLAAPAGLNCSP